MISESDNYVKVAFLSRTGKTVISIFRVNGEIVLERRLTDNEIQIDISALPQGVYFVRVWNERLIETVKMIKQ